MPQKLLIDCATGVATLVDLTAAEVAQQQTDALAADQAGQASAAATTELAGASTDLRDQYATALARLDQIIGATTFTTAQVVAAVQDMARIERRILRLLKDALAP